MAVLNDTDRAEVNAELMREISADQQACGITKADLRAAINAADDWANANAAAYNTALPQPARGALTATQKARLLLHVVRKRWVKGA